jgi:succinate dehydrogenase / fumarate reductase cytochrome b subunit
MTGVALSIGLIAFVIWLEAIAFDAVPYDSVKAFMDSLTGQVMLFGWCLSFFFHLSNGVRHLIWDSGRLFEKSQANASSWFVIIATVVFTAAYWFMV